MNDEEAMDLKEVVTVFKSGGGEVVIIPAKVRKELKIKNGDRFALYVHKETKDIVLRKLN